MGYAWSMEEMSVETKQSPGKFMNVFSSWISEILFTPKKDWHTHNVNKPLPAHCTGHWEYWWWHTVYILWVAHAYGNWQYALELINFFSCVFRQKGQFDSSCWKAFVSLKDAGFHWHTVSKSLDLAHFEMGWSSSKGLGKWWNGISMDLRGKKASEKISNSTKEN